MARRQKRRQTYTYVGRKTKSDIARLAKLKPSLAKLRGKSRITSAEKAELTRAKKQLRDQHNLKPVTEKQAKLLKKKGLLANIRGVRAIKLRETSPDAKIRVHNDGVVVVSNGRTWEYHPNDADAASLITEGEALLQRKDVAQINLWTAAGRANKGFSDPEQWAAYIQNKFTQYANADDYISGIAARIKGKRGE